VRFHELRDRGVLLSRRHVNRLESEGKFPRRVKISSKRVAWVCAEIDDYVDAMIKERPARPRKKEKTK
jgi:predicted DNA-binding transcriptional regulator AlpA